MKTQFPGVEILPIGFCNILTSPVVPSEGLLCSYTGIVLVRNEVFLSSGLLRSPPRRASLRQSDRRPEGLVHRSHSGRYSGAMFISNAVVYCMGFIVNTWKFRTSKQFTFW